MWCATQLVLCVTCTMAAKYSHPLFLPSSKRRGNANGTQEKFIVKGHHNKKRKLQGSTLKIPKIKKITKGTTPNNKTFPQKQNKKMPTPNPKQHLSQQTEWQKIPTNPQQQHCSPHLDFFLHGVGAGTTTEVLDKPLRPASEVPAFEGTVVPKRETWVGHDMSDIQKFPQCTL